VLPLAPWPAGLDAVERVGGSASYLFAVNNGTTPVPLPVSGVDLLTGARRVPTDPLPAGAVAVVRSP
jgi:beta-galactosidase